MWASKKTSAPPSCVPNRKFACAPPASEQKTDHGGFSGMSDYQWHAFIIPEIVSLVWSMSSLGKFGTKSISISTESLGRSKTVRLIAVPPFKIRCVFRNSCAFIQSRIVFNRNTFQTYLL